MRSMVPGVFAILITAGIGVLASQAGAEEWARSFTVNENALRLANLIGEIQIEGHRGSAFEVEVRVHGKDADRDAIHIEEKGGHTAGIAVRFPVDRERDYVYPPLGRSKTNFSLPNRSDKSWWKEALGLISGTRIQVTGSGDGMEVWADVTVRVPSGGRLLVEHGVGRTFARDVDGDLDLNTRSGGVEVTAVNGMLTVDTGSGKVVVSGVKGDISLDTGSGSVEVADISGEKILIDTGSGGVHLRGVRCRSLGVDTGSGGIVAEGVETEDVSLDTGSGSVALTLDRMGAGDIEIDTGSGSIDLRLPSSPSARVYASTGSGGIDVDVENVRMIEKSRNEKSFEIGDGRGSRITLDTGSGSIRVSG